MQPFLCGHSMQASARTPSTALRWHLILEVNSKSGRQAKGKRKNWKDCRREAEEGEEEEEGYIVFMCSA